MQKPKQIPRPDLQDAQKLTPLQLNALKCSRKHTLLTPEQLAALASGGSVDSQAVDQAAEDNSKVDPVIRK